MMTANQGGNDILWDFVLKADGTNFFLMKFTIYFKNV